jgi:putative transposase
LSDGNVIENPHFFRKEERTLAKAQHKLSKLQKGTKKRHKQRKVVSRIHERICNERKDFYHKESKKIAENYQYICMEDLNIK